MGNKLKFKTEQEKFWAGQFGKEYIDRNREQKLFRSNISLFAKILSGIDPISSVFEFGANIGLNLMAIKTLAGDIALSAVEINDDAVEELKLNIDGEILHQSILDYEPVKTYDFVLTKTVLIHMPPEALHDVYDKIYSSSNKYICLVEYYNPTPVQVKYRGHDEKLFKRDFAGEIIDKFEDLHLVDYGFVYHRDNNFPQDDITWFLLEKKPLK